MKKTAKTDGLLILKVEVFNVNYVLIILVSVITTLLTQKLATYFNKRFTKGS
jgi:ABC-type uncharacterized transport system fused permease/ATPase subunit